MLHWLASSNYRSEFRRRSSDISERVIFPAGPTESHGMEDVRLVRFVHDDGRSSTTAPTPRSMDTRSCPSSSRPPTSERSASQRSAVNVPRTRAWRCSRGSSTAISLRWDVRTTSTTS